MKLVTDARVLCCAVCSLRRSPTLYEELHLSKRVFAGRARLSIAKQLAHALSYLHARDLIVNRLTSKIVYLDPKVKLYVVNLRLDESPASAAGSRSHSPDAAAVSAAAHFVSASTNSEPCSSSSARRISATGSGVQVLQRPKSSPPPAAQGDAPGLLHPDRARVNRCVQVLTCTLHGPPETHQLPPLVPSRNLAHIQNCCAVLYARICHSVCCVRATRLGYASYNSTLLDAQHNMSYQCIMCHTLNK